MRRAHEDATQVVASLIEGMPAVYREDLFASELVAAFDQVLAPVNVTVDCIDAYFDPFLTPADFLAFLARWAGIALDERLPIERQRDFVARACELYRWRGTKRGIEEAVELYTGIRPAVTDSGATEWAAAPGGPMPGEPTPSASVVLTVPRGVEIDVDLVGRIVDEARPAHVPTRVEVRRAPANPARGAARA